MRHTDKLLFSLGEKIAELNIALSEVKSPILASRKLFWDLQNATLSYHKTQLIKEPEKRKLVNYYFDRFRQFVLPHLHTLRHSIIHGDLNDYNILVKDGKIEGFLDFGDATYTPLINELAIAMTYIMLGKEHPFEQLLPLLKGYHKINPLTKPEVELLPELITTRLCISLCNSAEKKHIRQDNEYVLISEEPGWALIEKWIKVNPLKIKKLFFDATGFESEVAKHKKDELLSIRNKTAGKSLALSYKVPVYMTSAAFQYMFDECGNTFLDAYNNIPHVGHCHPKISEVLSKQARILNTNTRYLYDSYAAYSEKLLRYFPSSLSKVFFVNSGSEATDLAIRMARTFNQRNHIAVLEHGYHGNSTLGIEVSSYKFDGKGGNGKADHILKLPLPNLFSGKYATGIEFAEEAKKIIHEAIESGNNPAAFIAEPISGCGGQVPLAPGYLKL